MLKINPYIAGNPVGGGEAFIGRGGVLRDVLRVLKSSHENSVVLFGQRRIGKTSVLQELTGLLPSKGPFSPVYFDLQDKAALPLANVLKELANHILYDLKLPAFEDGDGNFEAVFKEAFLPYVLSHLSEENALVLLFDEFDVLDAPSADQAASALFPYLRELMSGDMKQLKFIFVIGRRPEDLTSHTLSLFKGVKLRRVSLLSEKDTEDLVRMSEKNGSLKWPDEAVQLVRCLTGGHPFLTQQLCQMLWENMYDDDPEEAPVVGIEDVEKAVPEALKGAGNSLEWLWDGLQPAERVVASALAEAGPDVISQATLEKVLQESGVRILIGELQDAPRVLEDWDIIQPEDGGYRFRVEMLRQWVVQRKPLARVQEEIDRILPLAESLFQGAYGLYQGGKLKESVSILEQAVVINPNHSKANQLLAEIHLAQGDDDEALKILETLYEYNPVAARPRLVQTLLKKAKKEKEENKQLPILEKVLNIDPNQKEAADVFKSVYEKRGDNALKQEKFEEALAAYKKVGVKEKIEKIEIRLKYENLYRQATGLANEAPKKALNFLKEIIQYDPHFKESSRFFHLAVTGEDIEEIKKEKFDLIEKIGRLEEQISSREKLIQNIKQEKKALQEKIDQLKPKKATVKKQKTSEDQKFSKNRPVRCQLRKEPITVSKDEFKKIFKLDDNQRPLEYVENDYKDNEDETISDLVTGLMWQQSGSENHMNFKNAEAYIQTLNKEKFAGYEDWRLPTINELMSLLEPNEKNADLYIDSIFDKTQQYCWTSDTSSAGSAWFVGFNLGEVYLSVINFGYYVRAVRSCNVKAAEPVSISSAKIPLSRYQLRKEPKTVTDKEFKKIFKLDNNQRPLEYVENEFKNNGDETISDFATGLMWQQAGSEDTKIYKDAQAYIQKLNKEKFAGYDDWRLPTVDELMSLLEPDEKNDDLYIDPIFDKTQRYCWSSDISSAGSAWYVYFDDGIVGLDYVKHSDYVRAVRS